MFLNSLNTYTVDFSNMFLRGGLLIEPWAPYKFYTSNPRIQSVIIHNNIIYACTTSHQSGETFEENANKFISAGSGGTGSGGFGGIWDLSTSIENIPPTEVDFKMDSVSGGVLINDGNTIQYTTGVPFPVGDGCYFGSANNVVTDFSTTKWLSIDVSVDNYQHILFTTDSVTDIPAFVFSIFTSSSVYSYFGIVCEFIEGARTVSFNVYDQDLDLFETNEIVIPLGITNILFGVNTTTNELYIEYDGGIETFNPTISLPQIDKIHVVELFYPIAGLTGHNVTVEGYHDLTHESIKVMFGGTFIVPPINAQDGQIWQVSNNGIYNSIPLYNNDLIMFVDNTDSIILVNSGSSLTESIIQTQIDDSIALSTTSGVIYDAINNAIPPINNPQARTYTNFMDQDIYVYDLDLNQYFNVIYIYVDDAVDRYYTINFNAISYINKGIFKISFITNAPISYLINGSIQGIVLNNTDLYLTDTGDGITLISAQKPEITYLTYPSTISLIDFNNIPVDDGTSLMHNGSTLIYNTDGFDIDPVNSGVCGVTLPNIKARHEISFEAYIPDVGAGFEQFQYMFLLGPSDGGSGSYQPVNSGDIQQYAIQETTGSSSYDTLLIRTIAGSMDDLLIRIRLYGNGSNIPISLPTFTGNGDRRLRITINIDNGFIKIYDYDSDDFYFFTLNFITNNFKRIFYKFNNGEGFCYFNATCYQGDFSTNPITLPKLYVAHPLDNTGNINEPTFVRVINDSYIENSFISTNRLIFRPSHYIYPGAGNDSRTLVCLYNGQWLDTGEITTGPVLAYHQRDLFTNSSTLYVKQNETYQIDEQTVDIYIQPIGTVTLINLALPSPVYDGLKISIKLYQAMSINFVVNLPTNNITPYNNANEISGSFNAETITLIADFNLGVLKWRKV